MSADGFQYDFGTMVKIKEIRNFSVIFRFHKAALKIYKLFAQKVLI